MKKIWTRKEYHAKIWKKIYWKDDCPFCFDYESIWEWKHWYILKNIYPYSWNEQHLMAVPFTHKKFASEITSEEFLELENVHKFVKNFYWEENYFSCTRESMWNRSIEHYHMHFIPWRLQWQYLRKMLENQGFPIEGGV